MDAPCIFCSTLRSNVDFVRTLTRKVHLRIFVEEGKILFKFVSTLEENVNEARAKKVTKQMWKRMNDDKRFDALLSVVKDPDDAEEYVEYKWEELPKSEFFQKSIGTIIRVLSLQLSL